MTKNRNYELLLGYLRSILNDAQIHEIDIRDLDEPFREMGVELERLQRSVEVLLRHSDDFARGNLSEEDLLKDCCLCGNLQAVQDNLAGWMHEAREGDSRRQAEVCPGGVSEAFSVIATRYREREKDSDSHPKTEQEHLALIESYNDLLMTLTQRRDEWIIVIDEATREIVYCNKHIDRRDSDGGRLCNGCGSQLSFRRRLLEWQETLDERVWEVNGDNGRIYRITTFPVEWRGRAAWAHIINDITADREAEQDMAMKAYHDAGTGIYNRLYFTEYMQELLEQKAQFTLCYLDLDGLKYVNDTYGHNEGDEYIRLFVSTIRHRFRSTDIFARVGGDEFCLILPDCSAEFAMAKLESARHSFSRAGGKDYPRSFSYGLVEMDAAEDSRTFDEVIQTADNRMYEYKRENKKQRKK